MKNNNQKFIPVHAVEHAQERRHIPSEGKWRVPVDYLGKGFRYPGHVVVSTEHSVLSDAFIGLVKMACQRERGKGYLMEVDSSDRIRALYLRVD